MNTHAPASRAGLATASLKDTLALFAEVVLPTLGKGVIIRRPKIVALAERLGLDARAVRRVQRLRAAYGAGPMLVPLFGRMHALILSPEHVHRVLAGAPEPFAPATREKRAALAHFEPNVSLISDPPERAERRRFHDDVLESRCPVHSMAGRFLPVLDEEARTLLAGAGRELSWDAFTAAWHRVARRVVLGDGARDDHELTDMLAQLRAAANWVVGPGRPSLKRRFHERLERHLRRAEPGSLAARIAARPNTEVTAATDQVAQWLFAFDPAGMATFRALALLATHPQEMARAEREVAAAGQAGREDLPFLRACLLEALRLWPTTPAILRETTAEVHWDGGIMPERTNVLIFTPFFHRDEASLPDAHRFAPELWLEPDRRGHWPLVPFSEGPGVCPARHLVPMLGSAMIAATIGARRVTLTSPAPLSPARPLPGTLDNFSLRFGLQELDGAAPRAA
jgi:cytochrome P450